MRNVSSLVLAFVAAIAAPALVMIVPYAIGSISQSDGYEWTRITSFSIFVVAYEATPAIVGGIPLIWILWNFKAIFWWSATFGGLFVATTFCSIVFWPSPPAATYASHNDGNGIIVTVADGVVTRDGWIDFLQFAALLGALGALGGFSFWLVWRMTRFEKTAHP